MLMTRLFTINLVLALCPALALAQGDPYSPKLVVQITVDQLRADLLNRYSEGFTQNGFKRLMTKGVWFQNAQHRHANTETVVGHTTLSTGTDPAIHGMVANNYLERRQSVISEGSTSNSGSGGDGSKALDVSNALHYATADSDYPLLNPDGSQSDPKYGRSPREILSTTIGDEVRLSRGAAAKVFGVSMKDRAAIGATGHAGTAFWYSTSASTFVTSTFYLTAYPQWVKDWTAQQLPAGYANQDWKLLQPSANYSFADYDDQLWENNYPGWGRTFPHNHGPLNGPLFQPTIQASPAADTLTLDFAKTMIAGEALGQDDVTDYLAISLNSVDYIGHAFGPSSLEAEDNIKRLDAGLADLFDYLDSHIGLEHVLIVLSADHGATEIPGYANARLRADNKLFDYTKVETQAIMAAYKKSKNISEPLSSYTSPYVYLQDAIIQKYALDRNEVLTVVSQTLQAMNGVARVFSHDQIAHGAVPNDQIGRAVTASFYPARAGDLYLIFDPGWFYEDPSPLASASQHGSPYAYDRHVPLFFMGTGIAPAHVVRKVETIDVAPSIAAYARTRFPSGTRGVILPEVMGK